MNRNFLGIAVSLLLATDFIAQAGVSVGATNGAVCATVPLPVTLHAPTGAASMQFDLAFTSDALIGVGASAAGSLAGFRVDGFAVSAGHQRVIVWSPDGRRLPARGIVNVAFYLTTNAPATNPVMVAEVLVSDALGGALDAGGVTNGAIAIRAVADTKPPSLTLAFPAPNARLVSTNGLFTLRGKVSDNIGVCAVQWRINGGSYQGAQAINNWTVTAQAQPGLNLIEAKAVDGVGKESMLLTRRFTWVPAQALTLERSGRGAIAGPTNGQVLELGRSYMLMASPAGGWFFNGWSGDTNSETPLLKFVMRSNLTLHASFVTNLFPRLAGAWNGLTMESEPRPESSGLLNGALTLGGSLSGKLLLGGAMLPFQGQFKPDGTLNASILRVNRSSLRLQLEASLADPASPMTGLLADSNWTANIMLFRNPWTGQGSNAAPWRGSYTAIIPGSDFPDMLPGGDGALALSVKPAGLIQGSGTLGDLTPVTFGAALNSHGQWPLFVSLSGGRGVILGWASFASLRDSDVVADELHWLRPSGVGPLYPQGFTNVFSLDGSRYQNKQPILNWINGVAWLGGGNLSGVRSNLVSLRAGNNFIFTNATNGIKLNPVPGSGLLQGEFVHPVTGRKTSLRGAVHQKRNIAFGAFGGTNESGFFSLQAR